ncbi:MAG: hypothetical protein M3Y59_14740 [Myxococcota bacterium]|nr:hypothetical protein [Myxococcota bacterium]
MATKNVKSKKDLQQFLKGQLVDAQKRFHTLETDAEKALKDLVVRGKESRKDLQGLINRLNTTDLTLNTVLDNTTVKQISKKAEQAGNQMRKGLDGLQSRLVQASGVASQQQVKELKGELNRLSKKIDALVGGKKPAKADVRAS